MQTISPFGALTANTIPPADFKKLTRIPIVICYGGYIPDKPSDNGGQWTAGGSGSKWRALLPHASTATAATPQSYTCPSWASGATPTPSLQRRTMCSLSTCCPHGLPKGGLTGPAPPRWRISAGISEKCTYTPGGASSVFIRCASHSLILVHPSVICVWADRGERRIFASKEITKKSTDL